MPKLSPVSIDEFIAQMEVARVSHLAKDEPIPEMTNEQLYNVETCLKRDEVRRTSMVERD